MSTMSDSAPCPNCGNDANRCSESRPFDYTTMFCMYCGFYSEIKTGYVSLEELNDRRVDDFEMEKLTKLPKQNPDYIED